MRRSGPCIALALCALGACTSPGPKAGGQSGTEGGGSCVLADAGIKDLALDEQDLGRPPSPNQVFDLLEGTRRFTCEIPWFKPGGSGEIDASTSGTQPVDVELQITRGTAARAVIGQFFSGGQHTGECHKLEVDADVILRANGETALRASKVRMEFENFQVTHESGLLTVAGTPIELSGLELRNFASELWLPFASTSGTHCVARDSGGAADLCWRDDQCRLAAFDHEIQSAADCACPLHYSCNEVAVNAVTEQRRSQAASALCPNTEISADGKACINQQCSVPRRALCKSGRCEVLRDGELPGEPDAGACLFDDAGVTNLALDEQDMGQPPSPNQVFSLLEGTRRFSCQASWGGTGSSDTGPLDLELEIKRGTAGRVLTGRSADGSMACRKLQLDADVTLRAKGAVVLRASKIALKGDTFEVTRESGELTLGGTQYLLLGLALRDSATELWLSSATGLNIGQCIANNFVGPEDTCWSDSQCSLSDFDHDIDSRADCTCSLLYSCSEDAVGIATARRRRAQANEICANVEVGPTCINQRCAVPRRAVCKSGSCEMDIGDHPDGGM